MNNSPHAADGSGGADVRLEPREFERIAGLIRAYAGIALPEGKLALVQARLAKRLRTLRLDSYRAYCALLEANDATARAERHDLIAAMTTNVTRFFREPHHFEDLRSRVLPPLVERARRGERIRLWSAGCSTGEEAYSMAMIVLEQLPEALHLDVRILATDIDRSVLATAARGVYAERLLADVSAEFRRTYFQPAREPGSHAVCEPVRNLVAFKELNLTRPLPMKGTFNVIFCRNVVIYFDAATESAVWNAFANRMESGARLFVGHSERINIAAVPSFASDGITTYRRVAGRRN